MAWLVRWVAELLSKYSPGGDGRTPFERIRNEACAVPLAPFGETIMYVRLQTVSGSKGEHITKQVVWLGAIERTEEVIVGITRELSSAEQSTDWQRMKDGTRTWCWG